MVKMTSSLAATSTPCAVPARLASVARPHTVRTAALPKAELRQQADQIQEPGADWFSRRALLMIASALVLPSGPVQAYGQSSLCVDTLTEEEDTECRRNQLAADAPQKETYKEVTNQKFELAPNVPVAALDSEYAQATLKISQEIESYCVLDVYDKERIPLIKALKSDGNSWVSKYARGGSARSQSARRMYIAVDSVVGHLASNGYAPLPKPKVKAVLKTIGEAKEFLAKGI